MSTMLEIQGLTKQFGQFTAVNDISFSVQSGEVLGFLGPNGSGKSTTMKMVTGFLSPDSGSVRIGGDDIEGSVAVHITEGDGFRGNANFQLFNERKTTGPVTDQY